MVLLSSVLSTIEKQLRDAQHVMDDISSSDFENIVCMSSDHILHFADISFFGLSTQLMYLYAMLLLEVSEASCRAEQEVVRGFESMSPIHGDGVALHVATGGD